MAYSPPGSQQNSVVEDTFVSHRKYDKRTIEMPRSDLLPPPEVIPEGDEFKVAELRLRIRNIEGLPSFYNVRKWFFRLTYASRNYFVL